LLQPARLDRARIYHGRSSAPLSHSALREWSGGRRVTARALPSSGVGVISVLLGTSGSGGSLSWATAPPAGGATAKDSSVLSSASFEKRRARNVHTHDTRELMAPAKQGSVDLPQGGTNTTGNWPIFGTSLGNKVTPAARRAPMGCDVSSWHSSTICCAATARPQLRADRPLRGALDGRG
jgi:hypothetical protein